MRGVSNNDDWKAQLCTPNLNRLTSGRHAWEGGMARRTVSLWRQRAYRDRELWRTARTMYLEAPLLRPLERYPVSL